MNQQHVTILAIESSCDDTAAALIQNGKILANIVANQQIHEQYGGVVPELASRAHQQNIIPVVHQALEKAKVSIDQIDAIAYTRGPGLLGSLLVPSIIVLSLVNAFRSTFSIKFFNLINKIFLFTLYFFKKIN